MQILPCHELQAIARPQVEPLESHADGVQERDERTPIYGRKSPLTGSCSQLTVGESGPPGRNASVCSQSQREHVYRTVSKRLQDRVAVKRTATILCLILDRYENCVGPREEVATIHTLRCPELHRRAPATPGYRATVLRRCPR